MRLIDADTMLEFIEKHNTNDTVAKALTAIINGQPTVEAEQVIHCRNCKHRKRQFGKDVYCQLVSNVMPPDGYCSMAVGKEGK